MFKDKTFLRAAGVLVALLSATAMTSEALARQASGVTTSQDAPGKRISMGVGKSIIVDLPRDAGEIFVGNPAIANAVVRTPRKLYIIGVAAGQTTIFAMDRSGAPIEKFELNVGRDVGELQRILRTAVPQGDIVARTVEDTIILTGSVASAADAQKASDIAQGFLKSSAGGAGAGEGNGRVVNSITIRGRDQVMLKVTISEVQRQVLKQLGVNTAQLAGGWGRMLMDNPLSLNTQSPSTTALTLGNNTNLTATLRAFERYGVARVLAEPSVTAISGESAKFMAGGEVPVPSGQTCSTDSDRVICTPTITYRPYGVSLNFTPVVLSEGRILLRVATEVTEVDQTASFTFSSVNVPAFRTRKNETSIELPSGGSIVSAGLLQVRSRQVINGLPGVMNLPVLGALFRSRDFQREETELLIIVTPYIARAASPSQLARPDDGFVDARDPQAWLLGRFNKLYASPNNPVAAQGLKGRFGFIVD